VKKKYTYIAALAGLALAAGSANAALTSQLGILDLTANGGINPATGFAWEAGDTYRFIFATSTGTAATSTDIATYNTFVQNAANASGLGIGGVTWKALASTESVAANVNTGTTGVGGESFWLLNGTSLVADDYADLYGSATHSSVINVSETGAAPPDLGTYTSVWTGSDGAGNAKAGFELGSTNGAGNAGENTSHTGLWNYTSGAHWIERFNLDNTQVKNLYGVSEVLTVVPEPTTTALLGLGGLALILRRRK